jgi:hypothetical protein
MGSSDYRGGWKGRQGDWRWAAVRWCSEATGGWWAGPEEAELSRDDTRGAEAGEATRARKKPRKELRGRSRGRLAGVTPSTYRVIGHAIGGPFDT